MMDAQNEINEKCYLVKNDISIKNEITPKVAAEFAVTFYKMFKDTYDEKTFIYILKKVMEFFNKSTKDIPKRKVVSDAKKMLNEIDILKETVGIFSKVILNKFEDNYSDNEFTENDLEIFDKNLQELKKELKILELNKPFFLLKWNWKNKIKKNLIKLNHLEAKILKLYDCFYEKNREQNEMLENLFLDIRKNLKLFMKDLKPTIGEELADIPYEHVVEDVDNLKSFVFDIVISNFYQYYNLKLKN
ncbi:MAG: hypothetical protein ACRC6A_05765 [Fusobacteriaceae bacterium]